MTKALAKKVRERNLKAAPVDEETVERILKLAELTKDQPSHVVKAAVNILCQAMGRKVILREDDSGWELVIDGYKDLEKLYKTS